MSAALSIFASLSLCATVLGRNADASCSVTALALASLALVAPVPHLIQRALDVSQRNTLTTFREEVSAQVRYIPER
jgi:hypothetical protein